jgi:hypothetical protein
MDKNVIKEVQVGASNFRIKRFDASTGSWLLMTLMGEMQKALSDLPTVDKPAVELSDEEKQAAEENAATGAIQFLLMNLDEEKFTKIQMKALAVCEVSKFIGEKEVWLPLIDGKRITNFELQSDVSTIMTLTSQSLFANLSPFFSKNGLSQIFSPQVVSQE